MVCVPLVRPVVFQVYVPVGPLMTPVEVNDEPSMEIWAKVVAPPAVLKDTATELPLTVAPGAGEAMVTAKPVKVMVKSAGGVIHGFAITLT